MLQNNILQIHVHVLWNQLSTRVKIKSEQDIGDCNWYEFTTYVLWLYLPHSFILPWTVLCMSIHWFLALTTPPLIHMGLWDGWGWNAYRAYRVDIVILVHFSNNILVNRHRFSMFKFWWYIILHLNNLLFFFVKWIKVYSIKWLKIRSDMTNHKVDHDTEFLKLNNYAEQWISFMLFLFLMKKYLVWAILFLFDMPCWSEVYLPSYWTAKSCGSYKKGKQIFVRMHYIQLMKNSLYWISFCQFWHVLEMFAIYLDYSYFMLMIELAWCC